MTYVMSDLHGCLDTFTKMCETIALSDADTLYVLGDLIDRGSRPIPLLLACMERPNIRPLMGNHEHIFLSYVTSLPPEAALEYLDAIDTRVYADLRAQWLNNGGGVTLKQFLELSPAMRETIIDYVSSFHLYDECEVAGRKYVLAHSGLDHFDPDRPLSEYNVLDFICARPEPDSVFFPDKRLIFGHTPTLTIAEGHPYAEIFSTPYYDNIDCGVAFPEAGGRLACLCLDDKTVRYL